MDKNVKNVLAAVGALAVAKAAPVLAIGAVVGAVATNPEKVKETAKEVKRTANDLVGRAKANFAKYGVDIFEEEECECCNGGACTCGDECQCDAEEVAEEVFPEEEEESWEEAFDEAKAPPVAEEPASEPVPTEADKLENLRALGMEFIAALKDVAADALK